MGNEYPYFLSITMSFTLPIKLWEVRVNLTHCGSSKNVSSKGRVKHCFFVTFNISMSHIFPENFIEAFSRSENMKTFSVNISYFHQLSSSF